MRRWFTTFIVITLLAGAYGCGGEDAASSSTPSDPNAPMAGSAPTKANQFLGKWVAVTEGALESFEFMSDGKVLVTDVIARAMGVGSIGKTFDYKVLEGGRLSLVAPDGLTAIYDVKFNGDVFEIRGDAVIADNDFQRFRKLKAGETVESVKKAAAEEKRKAYEARLAVVQEILKQPKLVLMMGTGTNRAIAMDITPAGQGFTGKAWHEGNPPHLDEIGGQLVQNDRDQTIQLRVNFGRQLEPPVAGQSGGGGVTLEAKGEGSALALTGKAQFGSGGTPFEISLKPDPTAHASAVKMFETEMARIAALKKPVVDAVKDYVVLTGTSGVPNPGPNQPPLSDDRLVLVKGPQPGTWVGQGVMVDRRVGRLDLLQNAVATVDIINDKPMFIINTPQRQYQLSLDSTGKKLDGGWFVPGNQQGKVVDYTIEEALDSAGRAAQIESQKKVLASLGGDAPLIGVYKTLNVNDSPYAPVSISIKPGSGGGAITGTVNHVLNGAAFEFQGQVVDTFEGPVLRIVQQYTGNNNQLAAMAQQMRAPWDISVSESGGKQVFRASSSITRRFDLARADDTHRTKQKQVLTDAVKGGMKFRVAHPVRNQQANGILEMTLDPASGKITGTVPQAAPGFYRLNATIAGDLKEENGHLTLATQITDGPQGNQFRAVVVANFTAWQTPEGWIGVTIQYPTHSTGARAYIDIAEVK